MEAKRVVAILLVLSCPTSPVAAATKDWIVGSGSWNTAANWSPNGVPGAGDDVNIKPTNGVSRTVTYNYTGPAVALKSLGVNLNGGVGTATTTFQMSANNLTTGELDVGWSGFGGSGGAGTFTQSGGVTTVNSAGLYVGVNATDKGTYNLSGSGALHVSSPATIGSSGIGTFNQTGGTATFSGPALQLGQFGGSNGTYTISGGTLAVSNDLVVGAAGTGTLSISANASVSTEDLLINSASTVNLTGGKLRFNTIGGTGGLSRLNYTSGTIQLAGYRLLAADTAILALFGSTPTIPSGKSLIVEGWATIGQPSGFTETVRVDGGSVFAELLLAGNPNSVNSASTGVLEITNGGHVECGQFWIADPAGEQKMNGTVRLSGPGSTLTALVIDVGGGNGWRGTVDVRNGALLSVDVMLQSPGSEINLDGGTIRMRDYFNRGGVFNFDSGTIQLLGDRMIGTDSDIDLLFGRSVVLVPGKGLTIDGTATLATTVTLDGGTFTASALANGNYLQLYRGTLNIVNQAVAIGSGSPLGNALDVNDDMTINVTLGITNQGLVTGDGQIGGKFTNSTLGELRAQSGTSLRLTGFGNSNSGQIKLLGGELEFTQNLTNNVGGLISGNGSLIIGGLLLNNGTMNFAGTANIDGTVTNAVGGKIISAGGGTIFYDDVTNNGEVRTSAGGFTVFFGSVSGAGTFTGPGTVNFEGDLSPGNSPASVVFAGNIGLGLNSNLRIEIGGLTPGVQHDRLVVSGSASLAGTLDVSLINGFMPSLGNRFTVLTFGARSGDFDDFEGVAVGSHLALKPIFTSNSLMLTARPALDGDVNLDGIVDIFDVNLVSDRWGTIGPVGDANGDDAVDIFDVNVISDNWGATSAIRAVPEPGTLGLMALCLGGMAIGAKHRTRWLSGAV